MWHHKTMKRKLDGKVDKRTKYKIEVPESWGMDIEILTWKTAKRTSLTVRDNGKLYASLREYIDELRSRDPDANSNVHIFDFEMYVDAQRKKLLYGTTAAQIKNEYAKTPKEVYSFIENVLELKLSLFDPCPVNPEFDSLRSDFHWNADADETVYLNPPFTHCESFLNKTIQEIEQKHMSSCVVCLPARTQPRWFSNIVVQFAKLIINCKGGIRFINKDQPYKDMYPWGIFLVWFDAKSVQNKKNEITVQSFAVM